MAHITGEDRSQLLLLPDAVDDYVGPDNPVRFIDAFVDGLDLVNGTERCPVFGKIRCPIFCTLKDSNPGGYPEAALPSSSFTATLSIPALRLVLSR